MFRPMLIRCNVNGVGYTREGGRKQNKQNEKALRETQTLRAGRSNAQPKKNSPRRRPPSRGRRIAKI